MDRLYYVPIEFNSEDKYLMINGAYNTIRFIQAKKKERKQQKKLIVHICTFTGRVIALTIASVVIDTSIKLLTHPLQGHAKTHLIITVLAHLSLGCPNGPIRWLIHCVPPVLYVAADPPELSLCRTNLVFHLSKICENSNFAWS